MRAGGGSRGLHSLLRSKTSSGSLPTEVADANGGAAGLSATLAPHVSARARMATRTLL